MMTVFNTEEERKWAEAFRDVVYQRDRLERELQELHEKLMWQASLSKSSQEQTHALFVLARSYGIPDDEIDRAMLEGCTRMHLSLYIVARI